MNLKPGMLCWIDHPNTPKHGFVVTLGEFAGIRRFRTREGSLIVGRCWEVKPPVPTWLRPDQPRVREALLRPINPPPAPSKARNTTKELETA